MKIQNNGFLSIEQVQGQYLQKTQTNPKQVNPTGQSFQSILEKLTETDSKEVKFSKHAASRLSSRNIELTTEQMGRLQEGTKRAQEKGIKESLVLVDSLAFIVNIPNKTVVTAMDQTETADNIFTNIDGAVII